LYEFLFASSGRHALEALDENPDVRLVITDINMPEMNGWQLLDALDLGVYGNSIAGTTFGIKRAFNGSHIRPT